MKMLEKLAVMREATGSAQTTGIEDEKLEELSQEFGDLVEAVDMAYAKFESIRECFSEEIKHNEKDLISHLQEGFVNFYDQNAVNPYIALAAKGPWLVTAHGAVLHDSGGYGMLGLGHSPDKVLAAMNQKQVMANVMTASFSHWLLIRALKQEIGHRRKGEQRHPFSKFLCLNSGSESVTVAARLADVNAFHLTADGATHSGKKIKVLGLRGGFHGRTDRPAQASDSSRSAYQKLASFRGLDNLEIVQVNSIESLEAAFKKADENNWFYEMFFMEPVMGEGNPGVAIERAFYDKARELTNKMGSLLLIDSIQAGLRAHGCLSITDYPGFEDCEAPDLETYSKAVNAGQYPLSILAMSSKAAELYIRGIYGNTMTTNPRALDVACAVLAQITPELRENIQQRGKDFLEMFECIRSEFPDAVTGVSGTGLLCALHLKEEGYKVVGADSIELYLRKQGIGVIHGGKNALRFTPHFNIQPNELKLINQKIREALMRGPVYS